MLIRYVSSSFLHIHSTPRLPYALKPLLLVIELLSYPPGFLYENKKEKHWRLLHDALSALKVPTNLAHLALSSPVSTAR